MPDPLYVNLGMDPNDWWEVQYEGRRRQGEAWSGIDVSKSPGWHSHPALGITGHLHGEEAGRVPHIHRPEVEIHWDTKDLVLLDPPDHTVTNPRTGAERYFAEQMKDPTYAAAYRAASRRLSSGPSRGWIEESRTYVTKTGKVLTDEDIEYLADEAEQGYDVSHLKGAPGIERDPPWPHSRAHPGWRYAIHPDGGLTLCFTADPLPDGWREATLSDITSFWTEKAQKISGNPGGGDPIKPWPATTEPGVPDGFGGRVDKDA